MYPTAGEMLRVCCSLLVDDPIFQPIIELSQGRVELSECSVLLGPLHQVLLCHRHHDGGILAAACGEM